MGLEDLLFAMLMNFMEELLLQEALQEEAMLVLAGTFVEDVLVEEVLIYLLKLVVKYNLQMLMEELVKLEEKLVEQVELEL